MVRSSFGGADRDELRSPPQFRPVTGPSSILDTGKTRGKREERLPKVSRTIYRIGSSKVTTPLLCSLCP
jgi:hypothetical protein